MPSWLLGSSRWFMASSIQRQSSMFDWSIESVTEMQPSSPRFFRGRVKAVTQLFESRSQTAWEDETKRNTSLSKIDDCKLPPNRPALSLQSWHSTSSQNGRRALAKAKLAPGANQMIIESQDFKQKDLGSLQASVRHAPHGDLSPPDIHRHQKKETKSQVQNLALESKLVGGSGLTRLACRNFKQNLVSLTQSQTLLRNAEAASLEQSFL